MIMGATDLMEERLVLWEGGRLGWNILEPEGRAALSGVSNASTFYFCPVIALPFVRTCRCQG